MVERTDSDERRGGLEWDSPIGRFRVRGISFLLTLVLIATSIAGALLFMHMQESDKYEDGMTKVLQELNTKQAEMNYILTLSPDERTKLHLEMPDSLRKKLGRGEY